MKTETIIDTLSKIEEKQTLFFSIDALNLSNRVRRTLLRNGVNTVGDLKKNWEAIPDFNNMGTKGIQEIADKLSFWYQQIKGERSLSGLANLVLSSPNFDKKKNGEQPLIHESDQDEELSEIPVANLKLSQNIYNMLRRRGIAKIGQIYAHLKSINPTTLKTIQNAIALLQNTKGRQVLSSEALLTVNSSDLSEKWSFAYDDVLSNIPISTLDLSIRAYNVLKRNDIETVGQIFSKWKNVVSLKNVGPATLEEIQKAIIVLQHEVDDRKKNDRATLMTDKAQDIESNLLLSSQHNEYLIKIKIRELNLFPGANLLLKNMNIETIDQITLVKLVEIGSTKGLKPQMVRQIYDALIVWLNQDENRKNAYLEVMKGKGVIARPEEIGFDDYFNTLFGLLNPRYFSMIEFRYGLRTGKKMTLEETAKQFGVTRERIRQIESLAIEIIKKRLTQITQLPLLEKIRENIDARGGLISESRLIDELRRVFTDTAYSMEGIIEFVNKIFDGVISLNHDEVKIIYVPTLRSWSTSSYDKDQIFQAANKLFEILSTAELPMQWADLFSMLIREDGLLTLDESLAHAVALCMSDTQQIQRQTDGGWSKFEKTTRYSRIITVMRQIGRPAHFSEITEIYNQTYTDLSQSEHNIHSVLSGRGEFVRVGQGKYGLPEWGLHDDGNVANAVCRILANHKHPMNLADIVDEVLKTWDVQKSAVISAIDGDARFSKTADGKIWLTETGFTRKKKVKRDDDTRWDRLLIVLRELGKPFPVHLIVEAHNNSYTERPLTISTVRHMMYRKPELFVRTGRDEFGLAEWGLQSFQNSPVDRSEAILKILQQKSPLHIEEVCRLYNESHPEKQVGLNAIRIDLKKLAGAISTQGKGIYKIINNDNANPESSDAQHEERFERILKIFIEMNRPSGVTPILERYNQLHPADTMTLEGFMEYLMYAKNHPEKYSAL